MPYYLGKAKKERILQDANILLRTKFSQMCRDLCKFVFVDRTTYLW